MNRSWIDQMDLETPLPSRKETHGKKPSRIKRTNKTPRSVREYPDTAQYRGANIQHESSERVLSISAEPVNTEASEHMFSDASDYMTSEVPEEGKEKKAVSLISAFFQSLMPIPIVLLIAFWAKFAVVIHVPASWHGDAIVAESGWYVVYKSWWFGPPVFDLSSYNGMTREQLASHLGPTYGQVVSDQAKVVWRGQ